MKFLNLQAKVKQNIFTFLDIKKQFNQESSQTLKTQLARFIKKNLIFKINKGIYCFDPDLVDELELANKLHPHSYISLETALNYYGIIPDVPQGITSINLITTKKLINQFGAFYYSKIKPELFWGYKKIQSPTSGWFSIAEPEKALLDFFYIRKIRQIEDIRLDLRSLKLKKYKQYAKQFPSSLQNLIS